jgi:PAS domain S-box-containing protein
MSGPKKTRGMGIQNRLTLLLLSILLPLFVLQGYRYYDRYLERQEAALQANLEIARAVAKSFESFVQDVLHQELAIGLAITSSTKMPSGDIIRLLETSGNYPAVRDFAWLNPKGMTIYSNNPALVGTDFSDRSFVRDVISGRDWVVSELVVGKLFGKPVIGISRGIRDDKGNLLGVIFAAILPDKLDSQLAIERNKGGAISIVDQKGILVYRFPAIDTPWEERNWLKQYPEYEDALNGKEISETFFATFEGKDRLASLVPISSIGWVAGAGIRKEDVTGPIIQSLVRDAFLFLSVSLIAVLIASALSRKITNPIGALRTYASSLGEGKAPKKVDVENVLELQDLAESFDTMAEKVRSREAVLQEKEDWLRTAQKYGEVGVWGWHVQTGLLFWEPELEELYGLPPGTIRSYQDWTTYVHPEDLARFEVERDRALNHQMPFRLEFRIRHASGDERWMLATGRGEYDSSGQLCRVFGVNVDITESKRMEGDLRKAKDELEERVTERTYELYVESLYARNLIEASLDPLATIGIDGKITDVNRASEVVTGVPREQLIGTDFSDYFTEPEKARAGYEEVFSRGFVRDYSLELKHRDGHVTPVLYNATLYRDERGREMGVFAAARDITEIKQAEVALRKLASELVMAEERERKRIAGVLHDDVAQTLAAAKMRIDMLKDVPSDSQNQRTLKDAKELLLQSIQETRALMNDIGNPLLFDLGLQDACESLANRLMDRHPVRISCDIRNTFKHVNPDVKIILYQMFRELLNNVVKHSHAQNAYVMIDMEDGHFHLKVTDDGVGFDTRMLGAPTVKGGFGLYSIRERLAVINGSLRIESTPKPVRW